MALSATEDIIKGLTPLQRSKVAWELYDIVFAHVSIEAIKENADGKLRDWIGDGVERRFAEEQDDVVQQLLLVYAQDEHLEPALLEAITVVREAETLSIRSLLTAGMLINLTLFTATTSVEVKNDPHGHVSWTIEKKIATPDLVEKIGAIFKAGTGGK